MINIENLPSHNNSSIVKNTRYKFIYLRNPNTFTGIFGNKADSMDDLETVLGDLFDEVEVWQSGYVVYGNLKLLARLLVVDNIRHS